MAVNIRNLVKETLPGSSVSNEKGSLFPRPPVQGSGRDAMPSSAMRGSISKVEETAVSQPRSWVAMCALAFAAAVAATTCRLPSLRLFSWSELWGAALVRMLAVWIACAGAAWAFSALTPNLSGLQLRRFIVHTSLNAIWLAPLTLLIRENSLWTIAVAALLAVLVTNSLRESQLSIASASPEESLLFSLRPDSLPLSFKRAPQISTLAALCAQGGILAAFAGYSLSSALLIAGGFAAWTWAYRRNTPVARCEDFLSEPRCLMLVSLAFLFVAGALFPYLQTSHGYGRFGISVGNHGPVLNGSGHRGGQPIHVTNPEKSALSASDGESGIILLPAAQTITKLVAPAPMQLATLPTNGRSSDPLIIPFNGVYWFFKAPDLQPPRTSREAHVSPDKVDIRSTDRRPLSIEAHDYLGNLIDLNCCSRIQIAIRNADRYPETVSLELVLVNTSLPTRPSESLGRALVKSTQPWNIYGKPSSASETLNFSIPQHPSLHRFDEVRIVFRLDRARADAGAKIAIDHFVLVPRNL